MENKYFANRGVERNKTPLENITILIEVNQLKVETETDLNLEKYKFKDLGYLSWSSGTKLKCWHGFITPDDLKIKLGEKQWSKFCQGKREFIIQRRINGKNIPKE